MNRGPGKAPPHLVGLCAALWLVSTPALSQFLPPPYGFRPPADSNARGTPPSEPAPAPATQAPRTTPWPYGAMPWPYPGAQQPRQPAYYPPASAPAAAPSFDPYVEATLSAGRAYVQQTLVLRLTIATSSNLAKLNTELPRSDGVVFRQIGDPQAESRTRNGTQEIVNHLNFLVTPLRAGRIEIPPLTVSGEFTAGGEMRASTGAGFILEALPVQPGVEPWLALDGLELDATLSNDEGVADGQPLTLVIAQRAIGATGSQLPSPEPQLQNETFRLYRESSALQGVLSEDGQLIGERVDTFTLVPRKDRELQIPAVRIAWWNTRRERSEVALIPSRLLNARAGLMGDLSDKLNPGPFPSGSSWVFWLPLTLFAFTLGLYWTWIWARSRHLGAQLGQRVDQATAPARRRLQRFLYRLSPRRNGHVARRWVADRLSPDMRLWFCVRAADAEKDPADYAQVLRFLAQRRLGIPAQIAMTQLAERLIALHPRIDAEALRERFAELDASVYGAQSITDFAIWKRDFKRLIRPRWWRIGSGRRRSGARRRFAELPALNPHS